MWTDGEPVLRRIVRDPAAGQTRNVKSVAKTRMASLLGAAIARGEVSGTDATIGDVDDWSRPFPAEVIMAEFDCHADRGDLDGLALLDRTSDDLESDLAALRAWRQGRVRREMAARGIDAVILINPVSIRYATGARNMQVFSMRNRPSRYLAMTAERSILYKFTDALHLPGGLETIDEVRRAVTASFVAAGPQIAAREKLGRRKWPRPCAASWVSGAGSGLSG